MFIETVMFTVTVRIGETMKVGFAPTDWLWGQWNDEGTIPPGAVGFQRMVQYLPHLTCEWAVGTPAFNAKAGGFGILQVQNEGIFADKDDPLSMTLSEGDIDFGCDVIYMARHMHEALTEEITIARSNGQVIIQDLDDAVWDVDPRNIAYDKLETDLHKVEYYVKTLAASTIVVTSTDYIRDWVLQFNNRTCTIGNYVDVGRFIRREHSDGPTRVGWVGSTGYRAGDLDLLRPFAGEFQWVHGGHADWMLPLSVEIGTEDVETIGGAFIDGYPELFKFDMGVVPLNDVPFNLGKSNLKGLEYAASGIPFVASNLGEYRDLHAGGIGLLASNEVEWASHLHRLGDYSYRLEQVALNDEAMPGYDIKAGALLFQKFLEMASQLR
jgi:hypothetical protein